MKYAIRAIKYFIYFTVIIVIMFAILIAVHAVESDINELFKNGYDSIWQIALMFAAISAFYPLFGFTKKVAAVNGSLEERRSEIVNYMESRKYVLASDMNGELKFRRANTFQRITRMLEDTVTIKQEFGGFEFEGLRKDVVILAYGLENTLNPKKED